ncbi:MAG: Tyrosine-tRNA ligase [Candidatus Uhrbacteria bacterium GW2011_GWF2_41_16]|uniref:Tyrosine--tRNA ligase n=2 Tax=Candidatus Uhriibacteriota TaxID=1752732 RepID=A0A0G0XMY6_9BACT|nr:MAG: Tyrosine-tRNA ligase [Candidatus Uhrbacteria bacterium GW2011_GWA2_41_10]KKR87233.1 MAG: Tyrosine-tRNA ligase [Candidatus Uhrbacteria bacterium GW2011_GWC2_41_11]KKR98150.1 MAG: Tyrosine-tRNA ligase [Candidatus Uhrbacteria bacterium GW2011_GWF2_41_16]HBP00487.1 tyrosine--tRNA ligase [Candidatus Uhrbacteria bacterium]
MDDKNKDQQLDEVLTRAVEHVYPSLDEVRERLKKGSVTLYLGIDPTGPTLHLGHAINLRKMRVLQNLGHKLILLIGDFTGMIGDPTDKSAARKHLTREEVLTNAARYKEQASKIIRFDGSNPAEIRYNSDWLGTMSFGDVVELASHFTVQQMMERDMFEKRLEENRPIHLHEFLYPLMQGYDSVAMDVDGEIGGNDQTFNMLAGRTLMREMKGKEKFVLTMKLLTDPTGKKMGKSEGNMITLDDSPDEMFGKVMSWPDGMILSGFELLTDISKTEITSIEETMKGGANPRDFKAQLGQNVVDFFHGHEAAQTVLEHFEAIFQRKEIPDEMSEYVLIHEKISVLDLLVKIEFASSKSEARRLIEGGGVKINGEEIKTIDVVIEPGIDGLIFQKGKRHFVKIIRG